MEKITRDWQPTPELRWRNTEGRPYRELQQRWTRDVDHGYGTGPETEEEWRDVPHVGWNF